MTIIYIVSRSQETKVIGVYATLSDARERARLVSLENGLLNNDIIIEKLFIFRLKAEDGSFYYKASTQTTLKYEDINNE